MKKVSMYSHTPGFRSWGREWSREVEVVAVVEELGEQGRERDGCDFAITEAEFAKVEPLAAHPEFPLCIGDGEASTATKSETERLQRERDAMARSIEELHVQRETVEREIADFEAQRAKLEREVAELRDAASAAEGRALAAEAKLEAMAEREAEESEISAAEADDDQGVELEAPSTGTATPGKRNKSRGGRRR